MGMPALCCDAKLWTEGKTVQVWGGQSPDRKKEREMPSFGSEVCVCDLGQQRH